jgi:hypothetical protein
MSNGDEMPAGRMEGEQMSFRGIDKGEMPEGRMNEGETPSVESK